jgi:2-amino-4-hydroxy-6-hydroxymethyldihydropteridine diphosphokinase
MFKKVLLSLGSNIGDRSNYIKKAIGILDTIKGIKVLSKSSLMETSPVGVTGQSNYLNVVILIETNIPPLKLLTELKEVEKQLGRKPRARWAEREIDVDILTYEGVTLESPELCIPHKELTNRLFALKGASELVPEMQTLYQSRFEALSKDQTVLDTKW